MLKRARRDAWTFPGSTLTSTAVMVCVLLLGSAGAPCLASDLQKSTNRAAVAAKKKLCISLNQGAESSQLRDRFFEFYEGQIVSAERLHPETFETGQIGPLSPFRVIQVLGPDQMLVSIDSGIFKLNQVATADVANRQTIRLDDFFLVRGTETYETVAGGTNTVYILEPAKGKMPAVKPSRVYPWYNRKDEVVVVGEFTGINGPNAVFAVNGQESSIPLIKFSRGDRDLMRIIADRYFKEDTEPQAREPEASARRPVGLD
jgi:hypothetical protein